MSGRATSLLLLLPLLAAACDRPRVRTTHYADGQIWSEIRFRDGLPEGRWTTWYENGKKKSEGAYAGGLRHGLWRTWFEDSEPHFEGRFVHGKPDGEWRYRFPGGDPASHGAYRDGRMHGTWTEWFGGRSSQGSGGTISGVGKYLKEQNPRVKIYAVEPAECPILSGGQWGPHQIEGIGDGFIPENLDLDYVDGIVTVSSQESIAMARRLALEEGIFCGISSGCNVAAANKLSPELPGAKLIVTMINDTGMRYFSTPLFGHESTTEIPEREHPISEADRRNLARRNLHIVR